MNAEEIKAKAKWLSEMYAAKANGEVLQLKDGTIKLWLDHPNDYGPTLQSDTSNWRLKPKPRRMWQKVNKAGGEENPITDPIRVMLWRQEGFTVTEWVEALPE
jgi:hypothetical protein